MLSYNQCDQTALQDLEWLEFFAGVGNLTRQMKSAQYRAVRFDLLDHTPPKGSKRSNFMDMNTASGYAFLGLIFVTRWGGHCTHCEFGNWNTPYEILVWDLHALMYCFFGIWWLVSINKISDNLSILKPLGFQRWLSKSWFTWYITIPSSMARPANLRLCILMVASRHAERLRGSLRHQVFFLL